MAVSSNIASALSKLKLDCGQCAKDKQFHLDAAEVANALADAVEACPPNANDPDMVALVELLRDMNDYHACRADAAGGTGGTGDCQWNPAYLTASGSPDDDLLALVTTIRFNAETGISTSTEALMGQLGWELDKIEPLIALLIDNDNLFPPENDSVASPLIFKNMDGICL